MKNSAANKALQRMQSLTRLPPLKAGVMPVNKQKVWDAYNYWLIGGQYLDISQKVSELIVENGNKWMVVLDGYENAISFDNYNEITKWADHRHSIPLLFNFYHGIEVILKGFVESAGDSYSGHNLSNLLQKVNDLYPKNTFNAYMSKYIDNSSLPQILKDFCNESNISIDDWYQSLKYPTSNKGVKFNHNSLKGRGDEGVQFYSDLIEDIINIRTSTTSYARSLYPELA